MDSSVKCRRSHLISSMTPAVDGISHKQIADALNHALIYLKKAEPGSVKSVSIQQLLYISDILVCLEKRRYEKAYELLHKAVRGCMAGKLISQDEWILFKTLITAFRYRLEQEETVCI